MPNLVLFSYSAPDLMTGAAVFAMLCGVVLMGGRSMVGRPLRMLSNFYNRGLRRESVACVTIPRADPVREQDVRGMQASSQRAA